MSLVAFIHIALFALAILIPLALIALLVWYFVRSRPAADANVETVDEDADEPDHERSGSNGGQL